MSHHKYISSFQAGESFVGIYIISECFQRTAKNGSVYCDVTLRDKSGSVIAKYWYPQTNFGAGQFGECKIDVEDYRGNTNAVIRSLVTMDDEEIDLGPLVALVPGLDDLRVGFPDILESVKDNTCCKILGMIFDNEKFLARFFEANYDDSVVYGCVGGLLARTTHVFQAVEKLLETYPQEDEVVRSVALTAAILHGVGSLDSFGMESHVPAVTVQGKLYGIPLSSVLRVHFAIKVLVSKKEEVDQEIIHRLIHCIFNQHRATSVLGGGVASVPMTVEASVVSEACRMDQVVNNISELISTDTNNDVFTAFDPNLRRQLFKGEK